jgi:hypothetical protein
LDPGGEWADEISYWGSAIGQTEIADMARNGSLRLLLKSLKAERK